MTDKNGLSYELVGDLLIHHWYRRYSLSVIVLTLCEYIAQLLETNTPHSEATYY